MRKVEDLEIDSLKAINVLWSLESLCNLKKTNLFCESEYMIFHKDFCKL